MEANAQKTLQINAKRRKLASVGAEGGAGRDAFVVPQNAKAVAPPISEGNLIRLQASVEQAVQEVAIYAHQPVAATRYGNHATFKGADLMSVLGLELPNS